MQVTEFQEIPEIFQVLVTKKLKFMIEHIQGDGAGSRFNRTPADFGQTKAADKSFDDYRKYVPYEPSQEISTSKSGFKQDQNGNKHSYLSILSIIDRNKPNWSKPETSLTQISTQLDAYDANRDILYAQTQPQVEEDVPTTGDRWNNTRTLDAADLENEYKVFKDFKLREGRSFHEEVKRDESPLRANKRLTGLDRVGHSPDSPFKMFGKFSFSLFISISKAYCPVQNSLSTKNFF